MGLRTWWRVGLRLAACALACLALAYNARALAAAAAWRHPALTLSGAAGSGADGSLYATRAPPGRWRGNAYVAEGGLLPYQRCGAADFAPGPPRVFSGAFGHEGGAYRLVASALSLWGGTTPRGRPTSAPVRAELLVTIVREGEPCRKAHWHHCATELIAPRARCRLAGEAGWRPARVGASKRAIRDLNPDLNRWESVMASTIDCFLGSLPPPGLPDAFELEFEVGEAPAPARFAVPACYQHVEAPLDLALCTQPHYNYSAQAAYFAGDPPYPHGTSLVDAFLLYHTRLQGGGGGGGGGGGRLGIVFQDLDGSFAPALARYAGGAGGAVSYRPHWELTPGLGAQPGGAPELEHQSFAESTCMWEQRVRARWTMTALSVDCFLLPAARGRTALEALAGVDPAAWAELSVTAVQGYSLPAAGGDGDDDGEPRNVLQRYPLLDADFVTEFWRTMPIGNPRLHSYTMVHWMEYGKRPEVFLPVMSERDVLRNVGLQVLHCEAARQRLPAAPHFLCYFSSQVRAAHAHTRTHTRTHTLCLLHAVMALNGREDKHAGRADPWLAELALRLDAELRQWGNQSVAGQEV